MRSVLAGALALLVCVGSAVADDARGSLWIAPIRHACLDETQLAAKLRSDLPGLRVTTGARPSGSAHDEAHLSTIERGLLVRVELLDELDRSTGSEMHVVPMGTECEAMRAMAAIIITRAVTPLLFRAPPVRPVERPRPTRPTGARVDPPEPRAPPRDEPAAGTAAHDRPSPTVYDVPKLELPSVPERPKLEAAAASRIAAEAPARSVRPRRRAHPFELGVDGTWIFPLDGAPSAIAGSLTAGYGWTWVGVGLHAGVAAESTMPAATAPAVMVRTRRIPVGLEAWVDLPIRHGGFRISLGPQVSLWRARGAGLTRSVDALIAQPSATLRASYRYEIRRFIVGIGITAGIAFSREDLTVAGLGVVARLPIVDLAPDLLLGVRL